MPEQEIQMSDRILSAASYLSGGLVGVLWQIACSIVKKPVSKFLLFNIFQSIFLGLLFYVISLILDLFSALLLQIPFINVLYSIIAFALTSPIINHLSLINFLILVIYTYLVLCSLAGKISRLPWVSNIILYQINRF